MKIKIGELTVEAVMKKSLLDIPAGCIVYTHCKPEEALEDFLKSKNEAPQKIFGFKQITGTLWYIPVDDEEEEQHSRADAIQ